MTLPVSHQFQYNFPRSRLFWEFNHFLVLEKAGPLIYRVCRLRLKCVGTFAETKFHLSTKRTSPYKSAGASVQSTTGSRGVRISGCNVGYTLFRGSLKSTGYPLHSPASPSLLRPASPCAIIFQLDCTSRIVIAQDTVRYSNLCTGPEDSRKHNKLIVVSRMHWPSLTTQEIFLVLFLLQAETIPGRKEYK
jgi:hypothetical protein